MAETSDSVNLKACRICLSVKKPLCPLFNYNLAGNYAEMLTAVADVKVCSDDGLPEKICFKCCTVLEKAYLLKTIAERYCRLSLRTDRKLRKLVKKSAKIVPSKKIAFNSITDIKSEIGPWKCEPKWEMELEVLPIEMSNLSKDAEKDIVIANTIIRKVDSKESKQDEDDKWILKDTQPEYLEDDFFQDDNDNDADYEPPVQKTKKFKKPKLTNVKVFKSNKNNLYVKKVHVIRKIKKVKDLKELTMDLNNDDDDDPKSTTITCYPILKNGSRGAPILLKRPKDSTVLKGFSNFSSRMDMPTETTKNRIIRTAKPIAKQREKLVCPVCGILTFTLGNHIATHQEKKKFECSQCPRQFSAKTNLASHLKQHIGIKDHICDVCGAGFYNQKSLVRHNLIHKGERPFSCEMCAKKFIARCDLNRHLRIHAGYKPYKCATCLMSFNAKHQLQNHERMHTGERPFSCEVCNVAFSYKVNLNNHVLKVHGLSLKFKPIHVVTEEVLRREMNVVNNEVRTAITHIMPQINDTTGGHENMHHSNEYKISETNIVI